MNTSKNGQEFIKSFEALRLKVYPDPGTGGKPFTIGWGHTKGVKLGDVITCEQAEAFFSKDLAVFENAVNGSVKVTLNQNQFDALVSLAFNIGSKAFADSTLVIRLNEGNFRAAKDQFTRWVFSGGKYMSGLHKRRAAEAEMFLPLG